MILVDNRIEHMDSASSAKLCHVVSTASGWGNSEEEKGFDKKNFSFYAHSFGGAGGVWVIIAQFTKEPRMEHSLSLSWRVSIRLHQVGQLADTRLIRCVSS